MRGTFRINEFFRKKLVQKLREDYRGSADITLMCNDWTGAMMLHDLGLRFNSPFVNLRIAPADFLEICANPKEYLLNYELVETESVSSFPVALLGDKKIYLHHYESVVQAREIWKRRLERMDFDNIWVLFVAHGDIESLGKSFADISAMRKLMLHSEGYQVGENSLALRKANISVKGHKTLRDLTDYSGLFGRRYYDEFDFVHWFSGGEAKLSG